MSSAAGSATTWVVEIALGTWFSPDKTITGLTSLETDTVSDVEKVSCRMAVELESGPSETKSRTAPIGRTSDRAGRLLHRGGRPNQHMRLVCSGFCPVVGD